MGKRAAFELSRHARQRMKQRGITVEQVRRAIADADWREPDSHDPEITHALKRLRRRSTTIVLRVIYNDTVQPRRIVTAYIDRRLSRNR